MAEFNLADYFPVPGLTADSFITLCDTLIEVAPEQPPAHVEAAIDSLKQRVAYARTGLVTRIDENLSTRIERAFDTFVDHVWMGARGSLEFYTIYNHEGVEMLTDEDRDELDFDERSEKARKAAEIHDRLFGNGVGFLRVPYPQQSAQTAARIEWLETKGHWALFEELVTPELAKLLMVCQRRYQAMVNARSSRDGKSSSNLREIRELLRNEVSNYCGAISTLYKRDKPETLAVVQRALLPVLVARAQTKRKPTIDLDGDGIPDAPADDPALDELELEDTQAEQPQPETEQDEG